MAFTWHHNIYGLAGHCRRSSRGRCVFSAFRWQFDPWNRLFALPACLSYRVKPAL